MFCCCCRVVVVVFWGGGQGGPFILILHIPSCQFGKTKTFLLLLSIVISYEDIKVCV